MVVSRSGGDASAIGEAISAELCAEDDPRLHGKGERLGIFLFHDMGGQSLPLFSLTLEP